MHEAQRRSINLVANSNFPFLPQTEQLSAPKYFPVTHCAQPLNVRLTPLTCVASERGSDAPSLVFASLPNQNLRLFAELLTSIRPPSSWNICVSPAAGCSAHRLEILVEGIQHNEL